MDKLLQFAETVHKMRILQHIKGVLKTAQLKELALLEDRVDTFLSNDFFNFLEVKSVKKNG